MVPWTDEQRLMFVQMQFKSQLDHYQQYFPHATHDVILENDEPVGRLYVERSENEINIIDITVLPRKRNGGIGTYLIRDLLEEATQGHKTVGIYVESFNPWREFLKRLGFVETEEDGFQIHLHWYPPSGADTNTQKVVEKPSELE